MLQVFNRLMNRFSFLIVFIAAISAANAVDYCDKSLCPGGKHIACNNDGKLSRQCPADAKVPTFDENVKKLIVDGHNNMRNAVAGGSLNNLLPACRMATIEWDDELAYIAGMNVKTCRFAHDSCRNTPRFKFSGQNLAYSSYYDPLNLNESWNNTLQMWFSEIKDTTRSHIKKYPMNYSGRPIGHFTVAVAEKNIRVGCASTTYTESGKPYKVILSACNYATTNMINQPIYTDCKKAASNCQSGTNPELRNLCSAKEVFDLNSWNN